MTKKYSINLGEDYKTKIIEKAIVNRILEWIKSHHPEEFTAIIDQARAHFGEDFPKDFDENRLIPYK